MSNLLETFKQKEFIWQLSSLGKAESSNVNTYRGDLILVEGKLSPSGSRNPPEVLARQVLFTLDANDKINFFAGYLHKLEELKLFCERYASYLVDGLSLVFFIENIKEKLSVELDGHTFYLYPMDEGTVWNEFTDLLGLEKGDFKGLGAGDKIVKVSEEAKSLKHKNKAVSFEEALSMTFVVTKEARGPV